MPDPNEKGFLRSLYDKFQGGPISQKNKEEWPDLDRAMQRLQAERPDLANKITSISPFSEINKALNPADAEGRTDLFGRVILNRDLIEKNGMDLTNMLAHEGTHAQQGYPGWALSKLGGVSDFIGGLVGKPEGLFPNISLENKRQDWDAVANEKYGLPEGSLKHTYAVPSRPGDIELPVPKPLNPAYNSTRVRTPMGESEGLAYRQGVGPSSFEESGANEILRRYYGTKATTKAPAGSRYPKMSDSALSKEYHRPRE